MARESINNTGARAAVSALVLSATVLGWTGDARGDAPRPVRLHVRGAGCTDDATFWEGLLRRTRRVRAATPSEPADTVEIGIARGDGRILGSLRVTPGPGSDANASVPRVVAGASCDEIVATMSLMIALAVDSDAAPPAVAPPSPPPANVDRPRWGVAMGVLGLANAAGAAGGGAFAEIAQSSSARGTGWWPSVRFTATLSSHGLAAANAQGRAEWRLLGLDACPWQVEMTRRWLFRLCASAEGGTLSVSATDVQDPHPITRPWAAGGGRLRVAWMPLGDARVGIDGGAIFPLLRDEFVLAPSASLLHAPPIVALVSAWVGVRFL